MFVVKINYKPENLQGPFQLLWVCILVEKGSCQLLLEGNVFTVADKLLVPCPLESFLIFLSAISTLIILDCDTYVLVFNSYMYYKSTAPSLFGSFILMNLPFWDLICPCVWSVIESSWSVLLYVLLWINTIFVNNILCILYLINNALFKSLQLYNLSEYIFLNC